MKSAPQSTANLQFSILNFQSPPVRSSNEKRISLPTLSPIPYSFLLFPVVTTQRHLLALLLLPFLVAVAVPYWLLTTFAAADTRWAADPLMLWLPRAAAGLSIIGGFVLFSWCVILFARVGQGTLAPWDPTRNLVVVGPYRYVRNPMISGVALILMGQALLWGSWVTAMWACVIVLINHTYFVLSEEPGLERRFGENYRVYKANVPRWLPRIKPRSGAKT